MVNTVSLFKEKGIKGSYGLEEEIDKEILEEIPRIKGELYFMEDSRESKEIINGLESSWEKFDPEVVIKFKDNFGAEVEVKFDFLSGFTFYRFVNEIGAVSFGLKE